MRELDAQLIVQTVKRLCIEANCQLPGDVKACIENARAAEPWGQAQEILDKWAAEGGTEELFAQLAMEHTEDPGSMSTGGLYTDIYVGQMVEPFENWCFDASRKPGDTGLVQTVFGYHIMYFVESHEVWISSVEETILYEQSLALVNSAAEKWPLDVHYNKIVLGQTNTEAE